MKRRRPGRSWRITSPAAATALLLAGCGGTGGGAANSSGGKGELLVWVDKTRTPGAQQYKKAVILPLSFYPFGVYPAFLHFQANLPDSLLDAGRVDGSPSTTPAASLTPTSTSRRRAEP
ncbi:hypothetical protein ABZ848_41280 [Streptomyces sp. NPDC047081]|uniref:hypothetical protein n=1 Tax=Streptomyces sp. NPDC047081 TaxID=3154706 RepID=UPI0033C19D7D